MDKKLPPQKHFFAFCGLNAKTCLFKMHFLAFWLFGPYLLSCCRPCAFISFHFGFLPLHFGGLRRYFLSFLALCRFMSFHFGMLWPHFFSVFVFCRFIFVHFLPFVASSPFIFGLLWRQQQLDFWPFVASFLLSLAFCRFMSFHFGIFWPRLLSCRLFVTLFPFIYVSAQTYVKICKNIGFLAILVCLQCQN